MDVLTYIRLWQIIMEMGQDSGIEMKRRQRKRQMKNGKDALKQAAFKN
jgi:hypothetical protein